MIRRADPSAGLLSLRGVVCGRWQRQAATLWLLALPLLACQQPVATATTPPTLWVPKNPPLEEPAPAPLLWPDEVRSTGPRDGSVPDLRAAQGRPDLGTTRDAGVDGGGPGVPDGGATEPTSQDGELPCAKEAPSNMRCIPGGPFWRGTDEGKPDEKPRMRVVISPFFMDTYEVTNEQYFRCVEEGKCDPPIKYYPTFARSKQPVVAVSWYEAYEFCKAVGKRLPTEAEWEKAARGPNGEVYPWGNQPADCKRANYEQPLGAKGCGSGITSEVGVHPIGRYGLYDMAGNSWEWVNDWKTDCYGGCKKACGADCAGPDPKGPCGGGPARCGNYSEKVLKGGSWYFTADRMRGAERRGVPPSNRGPHRLGFRCAKTME